MLEQNRKGGSVEVAEAVVDWGVRRRQDLESLPFGLAWAPGTYPDEVIIVSSDGRFKGPHQPGIRSELSFDVEGVFV